MNLGCETGIDHTVNWHLHLNIHKLHLLCHQNKSNDLERYMDDTTC